MAFDKLAQPYTLCPLITESMDRQRLPPHDRVEVCLAAPPIAWFRSQICLHNCLVTTNSQYNIASAVLLFPRFIVPLQFYIVNSETVSSQPSRTLKYLITTVLIGGPQNMPRMPNKMALEISSIQEVFERRTRCLPKSYVDQPG